MSCTEMDNRIELYLFDELSSSERSAVEEHASLCHGCGKRLEGAQRLRRLLSAREAPEPSPEMLVNCRVRLSDALAREEHGWRSLLAGWRRASLRPSTAVGAAAMIAVGFALGWALRPRAIHVQAPAAASRVSGAPAPLIPIASISRVSADPESNTVRIGLDRDRRVTLEGSVDNPRIRHLLVRAMKSYRNPGIRLDSLEALRPAAGDPDVQQAMLEALRHDPNAGVRLQALRSIEAVPWGAAVDAALARAARGDANPGVRVAAADALANHAVADRDQALVPALENVAENGADAYARMKALTALRTLNGQ